MTRWRDLVAATIAAAALTATATPLAHATSTPLHFEGAGVEALENATTEGDAAGAARHSDLRVKLDFGTQWRTTPYADENTQDPVFQDEWSRGRLSKLRIDFPPGMVGNPLATPRCAWDDYKASACPVASIIGKVRAKAAPLLAYANPNLFVDQEIDISDDNPWGLQQNIYNIDPVGSPYGDAPGLLGIELNWGYLNWPFEEEGQMVPWMDGRVQIPVPVRLTAVDPHLFAETEIPATFHTDALKTHADLQARVDAMELRLFGAPDGKAFLSLPSRCGPATFRTVATPATGPSVTAHASLGVLGCGGAPFAPSVSFTSPEPIVAGRSLALSTVIDVPAGSASRAHAASRRVAVRLPDGVSMSPGVAQGLVLCSAGAFGAGSDQAAGCPGASRLGDAQMSSPLLAGGLSGAAYLGERLPGDALAFRLYVALRSTTPAVSIKLAGTVRVAADGGVTADFDDLPQLPFSRFTLAFDASVLVAPPRCGAATGQAMVSSWGDVAPAVSWPALDVGGGPDGCAPRFAPSLSVAGDLVAGASSALRLRIERPEGHGPLSGMRVQLPAGVMGNLTASAQCSDAAIGAGACPADSRVGTMTVAVGRGAHAVSLPGQVFLTGPYRSGDVAGLAIVLDAVVGPIDLGRVVLRAGIALSEDDAALSVTTGPIPTMLVGIALDVAAIDLDLDRPGFLLAPTSCEPKTFAATFSQPDGPDADAAAQLSARGCDQLPASVGLSARAGAAKKTAIGAKPPLGVVLEPAPGAAMRALTVTLPATLAPDLASVRAGAVVGQAQATTPVLAEPLSGPVTLEATAGGGLPHMAIRLSDPARTIALKLTGTVALTKSGQVQTSFKVPDVPLRRFAMSLVAGGVLKAARDLCQDAKPNMVELAAEFYNNKAQQSRHALVVDGCPQRAKPRVTATLQGKGAKRMLTIDARAVGTRALRLKLPSGVTVTTVAVRKATRTPKAVRLRLARDRRTITATVTKPAGRIVLRLRSPHVRKRHKVALAVTINGRVVKPSPRLRVVGKRS